MNWPLSQIFQSSEAKGARSTALHPIQWFFGIMISGIIGLVWVDAPPWILYCVAGLLIITGMLFLGAYIYFLRKDPDALRSENYTLSKMAIERGLMGDDLTGLIEENRNPQMIEATVSSDEEVTS